MPANGLNALVEIVLLGILYSLNSGKLIWVKTHLQQWQVSKYSFFVIFIFTLISICWFIGQQKQEEPFLTLIVFVGTISGFILCGRFFLFAKLDYYDWKKTMRSSTSRHRHV